MLRSNSKQCGKSVESVLKKKKKATMGRNRQRDGHQTVDLRLS